MAQRIFLFALFEQSGGGQKGKGEQRKSNCAHFATSNIHLALIHGTWQRVIVRL